MDQATLISWLAGSFVAVVGALCVLLSWFARRIVTQLDVLTTDGAALRELMREDIHKHDLRITKLENWREGVETGHYLKGGA